MRVTPRTSVPRLRWYLIGGLWAIEGSRMSVRMTVFLFLISSSVAGMVRTTRGAAIQESELPAVYAPPGRQTYKDYCAACHGSEGKGHGPVCPLSAKGSAGPHHSREAARRNVPGRVRDKRSALRFQIFRAWLVRDARVGTDLPV
ncbi:MAG: hypothetical protein DMG41_23790 [Acidobacteria bacterium]|nr:MAG: hypothetical protein DMG42_32230 [Acidobacteriota bacterium]PYT85430.1 MAG: hypothetical protein DMG41_23790 [Acidobacteriota bacterium]